MFDNYTMADEQTILEFDLYIEKQPDLQIRFEKHTPIDLVKYTYFIIDETTTVRFYVISNIGRCNIDFVNVVCHNDNISELIFIIDRLEIYKYTNAKKQLTKIGRLISEGSCNSYNSCNNVIITTQNHYQFFYVDINKQKQYIIKLYKDNKSCYYDGMIYLSDDNVLMIWDNNIIRHFQLSFEHNEYIGRLIYMESAIFGDGLLVCSNGYVFNYKSDKIIHSFRPNLLIKPAGRD